MSESAAGHNDGALDVPLFEVLVCADPERTARFYCVNFGFELVYGSALMTLRAFGQTALLVKASEANTGKMHDPIFDVPDAASFRRELKGRGLKLINDVEIDGLGIGYFEVEDCDGRVIRFQERASKSGTQQR